MIFSRANFRTLSTSVVIQACGAATGIMTARLLGPVARGELATVILWPTILSNLALMGCNWVLAREVAAHPEQERKWTLCGVSVALATALLYLLGGYFLIGRMLPSGRGHLLPVARICLLFVPLDVLSQVLLAVDHGRMRWRRYNLLRASFYLFYFFLVALIGVTHKAQVLWFVVAFLASHVTTLVLRLWVHRETLSSGHLQFEECRHLLRAGTPYLGATVTNLITLQLDTILVVSLLSTEAAGIYAVASTFAGGQAALGEALGITSFAVVSNERQPASQERIITETFRQSALTFSAAGLALAFLIPFLVKPLFGSQFSLAVWPAVVLALAASLTTSSNILNQGMRGAGRPVAGLVSQSLGIAVMAIAAVFLLQGFGLMGMAFAVLLSGCAQIIVLIAAAANWLKISPLRFWPFGTENVRLFFQQVAALRLPYSRSAA